MKFVLWSRSCNSYMQTDWRDGHDMTWHDKANRCISWPCEWVKQAHKNIKHCKAHSHLAAHPLCCGSCDCMWVSLLHWAAAGPDQILSHCDYRVCLQAALCHLLQLSWQNMTVRELTSPDPLVLGHPPGCGSCQRVVVHAVRKYNLTLIYLIQERIRGTLNPFPSTVFQKKLSLAGIRTKTGGWNKSLSRIHKEYSSIALVSNPTYMLALLLLFYITFMINLLCKYRFSIRLTRWT